jgi:DNA topoisomerase-2
VLYSCFKRKLDKDVKVVQLAGYVAEQTAYHHGEASLHATIVRMAQDFVGANNLPYLVPSGQFGTRFEGGKDFASPRYIFTRLSDYTRALFPEPDDVLLQYLEEDGLSVEPKFFIPVIPTLLINGCSGIGTGWSSFIPSYHPLEVAEYVESIIRGTPSPMGRSLQPWVRGFDGSMKSYGKNFVSVGNVRKLTATTVEISELPIGKWTNEYKKKVLNKLIEQRGGVSRFTEDHTTTGVRFVVHCSSKLVTTLEGKPGAMEKYFKLTTGISMNNMHAFNSKGIIEKYTRPEEIVEAHYPVRHSTYVDRRDALLRKHTAEELVNRNKSRFVMELINGNISLFNTGPQVQEQTEDVHVQLRNLGFATSVEIASILRGSADIDQYANTKNSHFDSGIGSEGSRVGEGVVDDYVSVDTDAYKYLLDMPIQSLTEQRQGALRKSAEGSAEKLEEVRRSTPEDLWVRDLQHLKDLVNADFDVLRS